MKAVKYTKEGVVIPSSWMKGWGKAVVAHRDSDILILESPGQSGESQEAGPYGQQAPPRHPRTGRHP